MRLLRGGFLVLAVLWAGLLPWAAYVAGGGAGTSPAAGLVASLVYAAGSVVCHQRPERSFQLFGAQLAVCARCAGIYAGAAASALVAGCRAGLRRGRSAAARGGTAASRAAVRIGLAAASAPAAATIVYEWASGAMPSHAVRAASGALIGAAGAWVVMGALAAGRRSAVL